MRNIYNGFVVSFNGVIIIIIIILCVCQGQYE